MARRGTGRGGRLGRVSVVELRKELSRRQRTLTRLVRHRDRLANKLRAMDTDIAALGGTNGGGRGLVGLGLRKRPKNATNLVEALAAMLKNKTMSVTEAAEQVQRAGYRTTSPSFRTIVNQTLINSGRFRRVSRGKYTAK